MAKENMIIWTRPACEQLHDRNLFAPNQDAVYWLPCLETRALPIEASPKFRGLGLIVTSPNAIRHLPKKHQEALKEAKIIYTFSEKAFALLQELQCHNTELLGDSPNAANFAVNLAHKLLGGNVELLWLRGRDFAFDIAGYLKSKGFATSELIVYESLGQPKNLQGKAYANWQELALDLPNPAKHWLVAFASPSAVKAFETLFMDSGKPQNIELEAICLGSTTAAALDSRFWSKSEVLSEAKIINLAAACLKKI